MTDFLDRMIDNLLNSLDLEQAVGNSYADLHAKGLTYINLLRDERMTVKLYTFEDYELNGQGHLVYPHNHAYNFYHKTLVGGIENILFKYAPGRAKDWRVYAYTTGMGKGESAKLEKMGLAMGMEEWVQPIPAGHGYYLNHQEVHTIRPYTSYAAAVLVQFHDTVTGPTYMWVPEGAIPDCDAGLYRTMTEGEIAEHLMKFRILQETS